MFFRLFTKKIENKSFEAQKEILLKELFNSANQKKAVKRAARKSAEDQKELVAHYHELLKQPGA